MNQDKHPNTCTVDPSTGEAPVGHQLINLFWTIGPAFMRWAESHMKEPDLTPQRVRVLLHLRENGPCKMSELRDALGVTATNITALVDALEKDAMVQRHAHETDRRATLVSMTEYAHSRLLQGCGQFKDKVSELFAHFSDSEKLQLVELLSHTRDALVERGVLEPKRQTASVKVKEPENV